MQRFVLGLGVVSVLVAGLQHQSLAEPRGSSCGITQVQGGELVANGGLATKLESFPRDAFVVVKCGATNPKSSATVTPIKGTLSLSLQRSSAHNGVARFRLVSGSGIFGNLPSSEYGTAPIVVPYSFNGTSQEGRLFYQVQVVAPASQLLQSANNYSVSVQAELR
jgi:hypothetical protein